MTDIQARRLRMIDALGSEIDTDKPIHQGSLVRCEHCGKWHPAGESKPDRLVYFVFCPAERCLFVCGMVGYALTGFHVQPAR